MKESIIISLALFIFGVFSTRYNSNLQMPDYQQKGYEISDDTIYFVHNTSATIDKVYLIGNFMNWQKNHPIWKMKFDTQYKIRYLNIPLTRLKQIELKCYEFTFLVNDKYVDAPANTPNVIHCADYGYRYLIPELNN